MSTIGSMATSRYYELVERALKSAVAARMDLAVSEPRMERDNDLQIWRYVWDFMLLEPGTKPPAGKSWTIYSCGG